MPYLFKIDTVQNARETVVTVVLRKMLQNVAIKNEFKFNDKHVRVFQVQTLLIRTCKFLLSLFALATSLSFKVAAFASGNQIKGNVLIKQKQQNFQIVAYNQKTKV